MYQQNSPGWIKHLDFIIGDAILILIAFIMAHFIRFDSFNYAYNIYYRYSIFVLVAGHLFVSVLNENYKNILKRGYLLDDYSGLMVPLNPAVGTTPIPVVDATQSGNRCH